MLRCVRKEGKVFFAFGSKDTQISSTAKQYLHGWKGKIILQGMANMHSTKFNSRLQFFAKIIQISPKLYTGRHKRKLHLGNLRNVLWVINLRHRHPADKQRYKVKVIIKIKVSNRYKFRTGLSRLRASSPANSHPPLAQI
jgi:hypothetical protein